MDAALAAKPPWHVAPPSSSAADYGGCTACACRSRAIVVVSIVIVNPTTAPASTGTRNASPRRHHALLAGATRRRADEAVTPHRRNSGAQHPDVTRSSSWVATPRWSFLIACALLLRRAYCRWMRSKDHLGRADRNGGTPGSGAGLRREALVGCRHHAQVTTVSLVVRRRSHRRNATARRTTARSTTRCSS